MNEAKTHNAPVPAPSVRFERDSHLRRRLFVQESFHHQARANLYLIAHLVGCYTKEGDHLLDPMAGTGSLMIAARVGRERFGRSVRVHDRALGRR